MDDGAIAIGYVLTLVMVCARRRTGCVTIREGRANEVAGSADASG